MTNTAPALPVRAPLCDEDGLVFFASADGGDLYACTGCARCAPERFAAPPSEREWIAAQAAAVQARRAAAAAPIRFRVA